MLARPVHNLRGDLTDSPGRVIAMIGCGGIVAPFEFVSFVHASEVDHA